MIPHIRSDPGHGRALTTRRGFVTLMGFGVVSLYGLWAAYDAAPIGLSTAPSSATPPPPMGMAAMPGMGGGHEITPDEFRRMTEAFVTANQLVDGSVSPPPVAGSGPRDVYLMVERYAYTPADLRLEAGRAYRFRMMAMDTAHGASILGRVSLGGHIMRSPAGALAQMTMTFTEPGEYLVYCTVYCGQGHGMMTGRIVVVTPTAQEGGDAQPIA